MAREEKIAMIKSIIERDNEFKKDLQELMAKRPMYIQPTKATRRKNSNTFNRGPRDIAVKESLV